MPASSVLIGAPSTQSPKAYDLANLSANQIATRLGTATTLARVTNLLASFRDSGYRYKIHPAETAEGLIDANLTYGYEVGDPVRYGADSTGVVDSTAAVQTAFNVALHSYGNVIVGQDCKFLIGAVSLTLPSSTGTTGFRIKGSSLGGSQFIQNGSPSALITITGATPQGAPAQSQFVMENLTVVGSSTAGDGVLLQGISWFQLRNVFITGFRKNLYLFSALTGTILGGALLNGLYGAYIRPDQGAANTGAGCNLLKFRDVVIQGNTTWGLDIDGVAAGTAPAAASSMLSLQGCDIESNGTSLNYATGGLHIGANVAANVGYAIHALNECWFEANNGQTIQIDAQTHTLFFSMRNVQTLSEDAGHAINAPGVSRFEADNCWSTSPGATWTIVADYCKLTQCLPNTLADTSAAKAYDNVATSTGVVYSPQQAAPFVSNGIDASVPSNVATTLTTLTGNNFAAYVFCATVPAVNDPADYSSIAVISVNGASAAQLTQIQAGAKLTLSMSGMHIQVTQTNASAQQVNWTMMQIA